jgi:hypothetical protein
MNRPCATTILLAILWLAPLAHAASISRMDDKLAAPLSKRPRTATLKDVRAQGLRITPPHGTRVRPGQALTIQVDPLPGVFPAGGVKLGTAAGIQHDPTAPYSFEITVPADHLVDLLTVEAQGAAGERMLTDRATYVVECGVPQWAAIATGSALLLAALYASAVHAFPVMWLAVAGLLVGGLGLVTGRVRIQPSVEETAQVGPDMERYERREYRRNADGTRSTTTTQRSLTVTRPSETLTSENGAQRERSRQYEPYYATPDGQERPVLR